VKTAIVNFNKCQASCSLCQAAKSCSKRAIVRLEPGELAFIDQSLCHGCGDCLASCPFAAIELKQI